MTHSARAAPDPGVLPDREDPDPELPDISVVIVTYGRQDLVERCLRTLGEDGRDLSVETIVIDNKGGDGTGAMISEQFPSVRYVDPAENLGFARACNLGAALSTGRRLLMLNPDTEVLPGTLEALIRFDRDHPEVGLVGGRTIRGDGSLDPSSCFGAMSLWSLLCFATGMSAVFKQHHFLDPESLGHWQRDSVREVGVVTGCLLLASREVWEQLRGFDEDYFMYAEDADLSWRARREGFRPSITPDATVVHHLGATSVTATDRIVLRNTGVTTFIRKRWHGPRRMLALWLYATGAAVRCAAYSIGAAWRPALTADRDKWATVWRRRSTWLPGYPVEGAE